MAKFLIFLDKLVNYYLYFVVMACFLSCVPNINPNYPLFHYIFKLAGFYIIPPVWGFSASPAVMMVLLALSSAGIRKIYLKYFAKDAHKIVVLSPEEFIKRINNDRENFEKMYGNNIDKSLEENSKDSDDNNSSDGKGDSNV